MAEPGPWPTTAIIVTYGDGLVLSLPAEDDAAGGPYEAYWVWDGIAAKWFADTPWVRLDDAPDGFVLPEMPPAEFRQVVLTASGGVRTVFLPAAGAPAGPRSSGAAGTWWVAHDDLVHPGLRSDTEERHADYGRKVAAYRSWARKQERAQRTDGDHAEELGLSWAQWLRQRARQATA